jgi:hypothetical protein
VNHLQQLLLLDIVTRTVAIVDSATDSLRGVSFKQKQKKIDF